MKSVSMLLPKLGVAVLLMAALALLLTLSPAGQAIGETTSSNVPSSGQGTSSTEEETTTTADETTTSTMGGETSTTAGEATSTTARGAQGPPNGQGPPTTEPTTGSGSIEWTGNGADQIPEDCDTIVYHFVLTPGGPLDFTSATLDATFSGSGVVSVSAYKITGGAAHFSVTGTGELQGASADFDFVGNSPGNMVLTISDAECVEETTTTSASTTSTTLEGTTSTTASTTTTTEGATTTTTQGATTTTVLGVSSTTSTTVAGTTTTSTTVAGATSTTSTTGTTVAGVSTTTRTPTRVEAGGGAAADLVSGWRVLSLLGALVAGLFALAAVPRTKRQ